MSQTVKMKKNNRVLYVESGRAASFLQQGYDQIDESGKIVKRATGGRKVSLPEYNKVLEELEALKKGEDSNEELEKLQSENEELKKENTSLKGQVTKLQNAVKETKK